MISAAMARPKESVLVPRGNRMKTLSYAASLDIVLPRG